jgi:peptide/nickel transport system ATP-binding protein
MYLGRIVEVGPVEQVLTAPTHPYTKALLSVVPETRRLRPVLLPGEIPDPTRIPRGCRFHPRCPALASGEAEAAGVAGKCRDVSPRAVPADASHGAACWLAGQQIDADIS